FQGDRRQAGEFLFPHRRATARSIEPILTGARQDRAVQQGTRCAGKAPAAQRATRIHAVASGEEPLGGKREEGRGKREQLSCSLKRTTIYVSSSRFPLPSSLFPLPSPHSHSIVA